MFLFHIFFYILLYERNDSFPFGVLTDVGGDERTQGYYLHIVFFDVNEGFLNELCGDSLSTKLVGNFGVGKVDVTIFVDHVLDLGNEFIDVEFVLLFCFVVD